MASEQIAKVYESVAAFCVHRAKSGTAFESYAVERELQLPGINIRSDVILKAPDGSAKGVFLVTHSGIEVHWAEKFKRDSAEILELTTSDISLEIIARILFDAKTLPALESISRILLSGIVRVPDHDSTNSIGKFGHRKNICERVSKGDEPSRWAIIESEMNSDNSFQESIDRVIASIRDVLTVANDGLSAKGFVPLTKTFASKRESIGYDRVTQSTRFNRSISKLALLDSELVDSACSGSAILSDCSWGTHNVFWQRSTKDKGPMFSKVIGNKYRCIDPEIRGGRVGGERKGYDIRPLTELLPSPMILNVIQRGKQDMLQHYKLRVAAPGILLATIGYIAEKYSKLTNPKHLNDIFQQVYVDPKATFEGFTGGKWEPTLQWHWLFTGLVALFKAVAQKKQGYGYSVISRHMKTPRFKRAVEHSILQHFEYCLRPLDSALVAEVAASMSHHLSQIASNEIEKMNGEAVKYFVWSEIEDKVIPHGVDVLPALIELHCEASGIQLSRTTLRSCLADAVSSTGSAGVTNVYRVDNTIIWYKACHYRANIQHKRKELQSIVSGWMHSWDAKSDSFHRRLDVANVVLVIDGDWELDDLILLHKFGFDHFLYPHELGCLGDLIK